MNRKLYWGLSIFLVLMIGTTVYQVISDQKEIAELKKDTVTESVIEQSNKPKTQEAEIRLLTKAPAENVKIAEKSIIATTQDNKTTGTNKPGPSPVSATIGTEHVEIVAESPYGFGPYPEIPIGFPFENPWMSPVNDLSDKEAIVFELIHRVHIKLWNEGKRPEGLSYENGVIYATYPNTIYVTWDTVENDDGTVERYPSEVTSGTLSDEANALLDEGIIPPDVIVYDHDEVGINPYTYLELE